MQEPFDPSKVGDTQVDCDYCWKGKFGPHPHSQGGSGADEIKTVRVHRFPDADASPPRGIPTGGSGAGGPLETSEPMPRGIIHDRGCRCWPHIEASAVAQLRADLDAALERAAYAERVWRELGASREQLQADLAQARARNALLEQVAAAVRAFYDDSPACPPHFGQLLAALDAAQAAGGDSES